MPIRGKENSEFFARDDDATRAVTWTVATSSCTIMRVLAPSDCKLESRLLSTDSEIEDTHSHRQALPMPAIPTNIPSVTLEADLVTDSMAARLCISLVGHVLFLKSQVPL